MRRKIKQWTDEDVEMLRELYPKHSTEECAAIMGRSISSVKGATRRYNIKSGRDGRIVKGATAWNKGMKGLDLNGGKGQFEKGHQPHNTKHDGAVTVRADGYKWVRLELGEWNLLHRVIWEQHHGLIRPDHLIVFKNGDPMDCRIENLEEISMAENARRNHNRGKASETMRELYRRERLRKKYDLSPIGGHGNRIVNYH